MKLNNLKSVAYNAIRDSAGTDKGYMLDPFNYSTPKIEYVIDLIAGTISPDREGDDIEIYYKSISKWFHEVLPKEGIPIDFIEKAFIVINSEGKECIIQAQGREFKSKINY